MGGSPPATKATSEVVSSLMPSLACQDRRNDISHFGGLRHEEQRYDEFMQDLDRKSNALSALYHLHLLTIIGVDNEQLDFTRNQNRPMWRMEYDLRAVGLLMPKQGLQ